MTTTHPQPNTIAKLFSTVVILLLATVAANAQWTTPDGSGNINNTNTGNVGIGAAPGTSLDVSGNILNVGSESGTKNRGNNTTKLARIAMPPYTTSNMRFSLLGGATTSTANIVAVGGEVGGMASATQVDFFTAATTNVDTGTLRMTINSAGNVGIGTATPDVKLLVHHSSTNTNLASIGLPDLVLGLRNTSSTNGNMSVISFIDAGGYGNVHITALQKDQTNHAADLLFSTRTNTTTFGERMRILSDGRVGIGTTTPTAQLHIMTASTDGDGLRIQRNGNTNGWGVAQYFVLNNSSGSATDYAQISGGITSNTAGSESGVLAFYTRNAGSLTEQMRISNTGNVGIGQPSPTEKLHVTGNIKVSGNIDVGGNINAKYQDMAEWVESSQPLTAGTVVVLDPEKDNQVVASTQRYDSRVAGVISPQPGIALGDRGEGRVLVAATGRVKVKVDASNGPIKIGDLLVTSDKEGVAMKSVPIRFRGVRMHRPGTLIGKALQPLAQGTGEILVLLSLQ